MARLRARPARRYSLHTSPSTASGESSATWSTRRSATEFTVAFDDGTERRYEVFERAQYNKNELPFDRVFSRSGDPIITLISCGGTFQRSLSSYEDNIVAYARPVE